MNRRSYWVATILVLVSCTNVARAAGIPNARLRVAVQQREGGKLDRSLHVLELICLDSCFLTKVTLNRCWEGINGEASFTPVVEHSSTWEGNLKVRAERKTLIVEETGADIGGSYTNNFRFGYRPDSVIAHELTSFSGGFVKHSEIAKKVITVEYVPLPKPWQVLKLDCGVGLPGVGE
ncbi:MAG: hypothetical protein L0312_07530 [Acidobacteria bacterium]|nr:hypothetical protein [Acidobacteriota bacterium]